MNTDRIRDETLKNLAVLKAADDADKLLAKYDDKATGYLLTGTRFVAEMARQLHDEENSCDDPEVLALIDELNKRFPADHSNAEAS